MSLALQMASQGGPRLVAGALVYLGTLRFMKWGAPLFFARLDARADRLDKAERQVTTRFNQRLKHVERELDRYRRATMRLMQAVAIGDPTNPVLGDVARILAEAIPMEDPSAELDDLMGAAGDALDGEDGGKQ